MTIPAKGTFSLPAVDDMRCKRTLQIRAAFAARQASGPESITPLQYALAHHCLEGAEAAARRADSKTFDWYRTVCLHGLSDQAPADGQLTLTPDVTQLATSAMSQTPYYLVNPTMISPPAESTQLVNRAGAWAGAAGFGELVTQSAPIICLLKKKQLGDTLDSWSVSRLPGTVFVDHTGDAAVLGRDIIHEAGHSWLNDALTTYEIKLPDERTFHSPWKGTARPSFGFLHACWAFPLTMIYSARVLPSLNDPYRAYLLDYLAQQRNHLASTVDSHEEALTLISDTDLRTRLRNIHRAALVL